MVQRRETEKGENRIGLEVETPEAARRVTMKQSEIIKQLTDKELKLNLILSQLLFLSIAIVLSVILFDHIFDWLLFFHWDFFEIVYLGVLPGLVIVGIDLVLVNVLPKSAFDDGGINERIFRNQSVPYIFGISFLVALSEEMLFRGVLQSTFGYIPASILFAVVHIRYLRKPVLFLSVLFVSLLIGYIFLLTENLWTTIVLHFVVDFLLGLYIRFKK